jgi:hypothetical protein
MLKVKRSQTPKRTRTDPMRREGNLRSPVNPALRQFLFDQLFKVLSEAKPRDFARKTNWQSASIFHGYNRRDLPSARRLDHSFPRTAMKDAFILRCRLSFEKAVWNLGSQESMFILQSPDF